MQVRSLFQDRTASWVRIVNGVEKYVNETTETIEDEEHRGLVKPVAKARPRMKATITLSHDHECYVKSKAMIRLLRRDQNTLREIDGAVKYEDIVEEFNKKKEESSTVLRNGHSMIGFLFWQKEEAKKRFHYCLNPSSSRHSSYFRAIQGDSRDNAVDPASQEHVLLPKGFTEYIHHVGNANELNSIIRNV